VAAAFYALANCPVSLWCLPLPLTGQTRQPSTGPHRGARLSRRFFQNTILQNLDPNYWQRKAFVCNTFNLILPKPKRKAKLSLVEVEPTDAKYLAYLKPDKPNWYIEDYIAIGKNIAEASEGDLETLKKEAVAMGCKPSFQGWNNPRERWKLKTGVIDMALLQDGAMATLGKDLAAALLEIKRVLKPDGRLFFAVNEEDAGVLGGNFALGLQDSVADRLGFELVAAKRGDDCGLYAGYMRKRLPRPKAKTGNPLRKLPRAY